MDKDRKKLPNANEGVEEVPTHKKTKHKHTET